MRSGIYMRHGLERSIAEPVIAILVSELNPWERYEVVKSHNQRKPAVKSK